MIYEAGIERKMILHDKVKIIRRIVSPTSYII